MTTDTFGRPGIFDDDINDAEMASTATIKPADETEELKLTPRAKAMARGEDPDKAEEEPAPPAEPEPKEWSGSDKRLAKMYGLSEDDLDGFESPGSLHSAIDLLDARKENEGKGEAGSSPEDGSSDADATGGAVSDILGFEKTDVEAAKAKYNALDDDGDRIYDEATAEILVEQASHTRRLEDALEKSLQQNNFKVETVQQKAAAKNVAQFTKALDDVPGMYGKGKDVSEAQLASRQLVGNHIELLAQGYASQNLEIPPLAELIEQSIRAVHGKEYAEAQRRVEGLKEHSKKRRSPGSKVTPSPPQNADEDPESAAAIARRPALTQFWENAQLENG